MPVMAPALVPAIMSTTMPLRSRALSTPRCDMPRAAPPPRATPTRTPRRSWTSRSSPLASDRPKGNFGGVSWILKSREARSGRFGTAGTTGLSPSSNQATLILSRQPRAGTSIACRRRIAASAASAGTK